MPTNYRYKQPVRQPYQSTFTPIPLEFLGEQLKGRQQQYDQTLAQLLDQEDKFGSIQVAPGDIARKNELINNTFATIKDEVDSKYGGDFSQAGPEVFRNITKLRRDPFFNLAPQNLARYQDAIKRSDVLRQQGTLVTDDDFTFNQSVYDPETQQYRTPDYKIYERGDYNKMFAQEFSGLENQITEKLIQNAPFEGYHQVQQIKGASRAEIERNVTPEDVQRILRENPAYRIEMKGKSMDEIQQDVVNRLDSVISEKVTNDFMRKEDFGNKYDTDDSDGFNLDILQRQGFLPFKDTEYEDIAEDTNLSSQFDTQVAEIGETEEFKGFGFKTYDDLITARAALESKVNQDEKRMMQGRIALQGAELEKLQTDAAKKLNKINQFEAKLKERYEKQKSTGIAKYDLSPLAGGSDVKAINRIKTIRTTLVDNFAGNLDSFTPTSNNKNNRKLIEKGIELDDVKGFSFAGNGGLILDAVVEDNSGNKHNITLKSKQSALDITNDSYWNAMRFLASMSPTAEAVYHKSLKEAYDRAKAQR